MTEAEDGAPRVDPAVAPLLEALAAIGGPDDTRPEAEVLRDLDARTAEIASVVGGLDRADRLQGIRAEIVRLHQAALLDGATIAPLREQIGAALRALGLDRPQLPDPAASTLALLGAPPAGHVYTAIDTLDAITDRGLRSGKFHVIAGEPNVGKTSLAVQLARVAVDDDWIVGFHVADVDDREGILLRIAQAHGIDRRAFLLREAKAINDTAAILEAWRPRFSIVDESADERTIDDTAEALVALAAASERRAVLFVDSLQTVQLRWPEGREPRTDKDRIDQVVKRLVRWTRKGLTVVATCEIPRGFYTGPKRTKFKATAPPALAAFKGSGNIEYAAWTALVITRIRGEVDAVRVEVPKNKQGREDVSFKLVRTESRVGYEDAGELHENDTTQDDDRPAQKRPESFDPYLARVRKALAGMARGFAGGRDDLARLAGGKTAMTRAAIAMLITSGEVLLERPEGQPARLRLRVTTDGPRPALEPEDRPQDSRAVCGVCGRSKGGAPGQCRPCPSCHGCSSTMPEDGGCPC